MRRVTRSDRRARNQFVQVDEGPVVFTSDGRLGGRRRRVGRELAHWRALGGGLGDRVRVRVCVRHVGVLVDALVHVLDRQADFAQAARLVVRLLALEAREARGALGARLVLVADRKALAGGGDGGLLLRQVRGELLGVQLREELALRLLSDRSERVLRRLVALQTHKYEYEYAY